MRSFRFVLKHIGFVLFIFSSQIVYAHGGGGAVSKIQGSDYQDSLASGAMIHTPTASSLGKNRGFAGLDFDYLNFNQKPAQEAHELHEAGHHYHESRHEESYNFVLGCGVLDSVDVGLTVPMVSKTFTQIESPSEFGNRERETGFGDLALSGKYQFLKKRLEGALLLAIRFPTGDTTRQDSVGAKVETDMLPGSGAWGSEYGVVFSRSFKQHLTWAQSFQYVHTGNGAQEFNFGDEFHHDIGFSYSLRRLGKLPNASIVIELNQVWTLRDHSPREGGAIRDSGGTTLFLSPGLSANLNSAVTIYGSLQFPIYQNLGGVHQELDFSIIAGLQISI